MRHDLALRPLADADTPELLRIHRTEEVRRWWDEPELDIFLDPAYHGRGIGSEAIRRVVRHLIDDAGHHRVVIDPAVANHAAIRCYEKAGFRPVGVMRRYKRDVEGGDWHDGLLMDLLAGEER